MLELSDGITLNFTFPRVHETCILDVTLMRTKRLPENNEVPCTTSHGAPQGLPRFPLEHVEDYADKLPPEWVRHEGLLMPMHEDEALCLHMNSCFEYPFAVKVAAGKICAVSGFAWIQGLQQGIRREPDGRIMTLQNYIVVPGQQWLDGFYDTPKSNTVRQFVAEPLGQGRTVEEKRTGKAKYGGLQIQVFPLRGDVWEKLLEEKARQMQKVPVGPAPLHMRNRPYGLGTGARLSQGVIQDKR
ncbi:MAG: hypothetical protein ACI4SV_01655, partial [Duodenibacillus sp.]